MTGVFVHPLVTDSIGLTAVGMDAGYYTNLIAREIVRLLRECGIYTELPDGGISDSAAIARSNAKRFGIHIALCLSGGENFGQKLEALYLPQSKKGRKLAEGIVRELAEIHPQKRVVSARCNKKAMCLKETSATAVLVSLCNRDHILDASWVADNVLSIAGCIVVALLEFMKTEF